jgi:sulfite exporter TauE/SafE
LFGDIENWLGLVPYTVFAISLLGSTHCLGMCGGIALTIAPKWHEQLAYHLGRLMAYSSLGFVAGYLGQHILIKAAGPLSTFSLVAFGLGYIVLGVKAWRGHPLRLFRVPSVVTKYLRRFGRQSSLVTGLLTALLPCGWLHVFVLGAVATGSPWRGSLYLFLFWAGTVPALSSASMIVSKLISPLNANFPRLSACMLILIGCITIGMRLMPTDAGESCPHHMQSTN